MLIYDGDCGFCTKTARWLQSRLATPISVVPWQSIDDLGALGLSELDVSTAVYWVDAYGRTSRGALGAARALTHSKGPLALVGWLLLLPPARQLAALAYPVIARNRQHLPGATAACAMPARTSPLNRGPVGASD